MNHKPDKTYVCFTCLHESDNPQICSNCGAAIEHLDASSAEFLPPVMGFVEVRLNEETRQLIEDVVGAISDKYHDNFVVRFGPKTIIVECNDIAAGRLVGALKKEFNKLAVDDQVHFEVRL